MIKAYTEGDVNCRLEPCDSEGNNCLYINAERGNSPQLDVNSIELLLSEKLPAHIEYELSLGFSQPLMLSFEREIYTTDLPLCGQYLCGQYPVTGGAQTPLPSRLSHDIEQSSMYSTVSPCWLTILNIALCTCQPSAPQLWLTPSFPWQP